MQTLAAHTIEDVPIDDIADAGQGAFPSPGLNNNEFVHMTAASPSPLPPPTVFPAPFSTNNNAESTSFSSSAQQQQQQQQHQTLVRQVSVPISESSPAKTSANSTADENDLAAQLAAALAANASLQSQLSIQSAHAHQLEEKVVSQGHTVSALCVEVDRLSKCNDDLQERLAMQMEQRRIETEQFRHHLAMFKATGGGGGGGGSHLPLAMGRPHSNDFRTSSLPGSPYPPPTKMAAVAPATATSPIRRLSTAMGASQPPPQPPQPCRYPPRRMSTGAAATCA